MKIDEREREEKKLKNPSIAVKFAKLLDECYDDMLISGSLWIGII